MSTFSFLRDNNQIYFSESRQNAIGIEVQRGDRKNVINSNDAQLNTTSDRADRNPNCDQDSWFGNHFTAADPAWCIH